MLSKNGKHIYVSTRVGKLKILYHILRVKVKFFGYWVMSCGWERISLCKLSLYVLVLLSIKKLMNNDVKEQK